MGFHNLAEARVLLRKERHAILKLQARELDDILCACTPCTVCKEVFPPEGFCYLDCAERQKRIYALIEQEDLP